MAPERWRGLTAALVWSVTFGAISAAPVLATPATETPEQLFEAYFHALLDENWSRADSLWTKRDRARAHRLGVRYTDVPLKQDLDSPLWLWLDSIRAGKVRVGLQRVRVDRDRAEIELGFLDPLGPARTLMAAEREDGQWRLASTVRHLRYGWEVHEGEYTRVFAPSLAEVPPAVRVEWDREVRRIGEALGLEEADWNRIRRGRIDVLLTEEKEMVRLIGTAAEGWADLDSDTVVTRRRMHSHELTHLLVNVAAGELPLYVLPVLQEGIAVHLGGRGGRSPAVMETLGEFVLRSGTLTLDDIVDRGGFRTVSPDLSYAVAGLFCGYLLERFGPHTFLEIYRRGAGRDVEVAAWDRSEARARIANPTGETWADIAAGFAAWWPQRAGRSLLPASQVEGATRAASKGPWIATASGVSLCRAVGGWLVKAPRGEAVRIPLGPDALSGRSPLREEMLPGNRSARGALVLSESEAGVYDFAADWAVAKWVRDFAATGDPVEGEEIRYWVDDRLLGTELLPAP